MGVLHRQAKRRKMEILNLATWFDCPEYTITDLKIVPPILTNSEHVLFGVDPGTTKLGLAFLWRTVCHVYEVKIIRNDDAVERILLMQTILSKCFSMFDYAPIMTIEGSSFNGFRQTELAEIRASTVLWAINHQVVPHIVPPLKIRKQVFGNGATKADEFWKELEKYPDAASALACAYYPT